MLIDISWVQWEPQREDVKFYWHWGRKRSCNVKGVYRALQQNLTIEFGLNKHKWRLGKWGGISNRRSTSSLQRYRGDHPCPSCNSCLCPESKKLVATGKTGPVRWAGDDGNIHSTGRNSPCSKLRLLDSVHLSNMSRSFRRLPSSSQLLIFSGSDMQEVDKNATIQLMVKNTDLGQKSLRTQVTICRLGAGLLGTLADWPYFS